MNLMEQSEGVTARFAHDFPGQVDSWAWRRRFEQKPPPGDWRTWLVLGGRGSGKTRA
jgi:phage terminase large subunit-like protein